jgi:hypothetical protein
MAQKKPLLRAKVHAPFEHSGWADGKCVTAVSRGHSPGKFFPQLMPQLFVITGEAVISRSRFAISIASSSLRTCQLGRLHVCHVSAVSRGHSPGNCIPQLGPQLFVITGEEDISRSRFGEQNYPGNGLVKSPRLDTRALSPDGMFG